MYSGEVTALSGFVESVGAVSSSVVVSVRAVSRGSRRCTVAVWTKMMT